MTYSQIREPGVIWKVFFDDVISRVVVESISEAPIPGVYYYCLYCRVQEDIGRGVGLLLPQMGRVSICHPLGNGVLYFQHRMGQ